MKRFALIAALLALPVTAALAADAKAGQATYDKSCKSCHGADGSGNPAIAKMMKVELKPLGGEPEAAIKAAVTAGKGKMKPVATVAGADLDNVVAYCKTLKK